MQNSLNKTEEWRQICAELKQRFYEAGLLYCELQLNGCTGACDFGWTWSFAHSLKRWEMVAEKDDSELRAFQMREVVYSCGNCHNIIERIGNKERFDGKPKMKDYVREAIAKRENQP